MSPSLLTRILALGVGAAVAVLVLLAVPVTFIVAQDAREDVDRSAELTARSVADTAAGRAGSADELESVVASVNDGDVQVTVVLPDGDTVGAARSDCAGSDAGADATGPEPGGAPGSPPRQVEGGRLVTVEAQAASGDVSVCAFVPDGAENAQTLSRLGAVGGAALGVLAVVAGAAVLLARRVARPLAAVAATADRLARGDLDARVPDAGPPEVRRVGSALNGLAARIGELLQLERETAADLSHRLRTPLMAIRLDVEALPDSPAKAELEDHVAHLQRTLTSVIRTARRPQREGAAPRCDVVGVARERFAFWSALLEDQGRMTTFSAPPGELRVRCAAEDLAAALDALLENAVAHTPEGTPVAVEIDPGTDATVRVDVKDQGPGIPAAALERGRSDRGSTGLGLDIARACAEATGGGLSVRSDGQWSVVRMALTRFPVGR